MLETINKVPETKIIKNENDLKRANCPLTEVREVKHILLNSNNINILSQDKSIKPYTIFKNIDRNLPDDYDANSKIKYDINPNLDKTQKSKLLSLLQKYESVFSKSKWDFGDSKTKLVDIFLTKNIPINLPNFKLSRFERDEIEA